jgi:hypothetical protein
MANTTENANLCGLKREDFQTTVNGKKTDLYILKNRKGYEVAVSNYGGAICAIMVPDKDGNVGNVIQGHGSIEQLMSGNEPYLSTLIGRWGNRICKGQFTLNGKEYQVAINEQEHADAAIIGVDSATLDTVNLTRSEEVVGQLAINCVVVRLLAEVNGTLTADELLNLDGIQVEVDHVLGAAASPVNSGILVVQRDSSRAGVAVQVHL